MTAEAIAQALHGKRAGSGYMVQCVAHEDRTPSLSISDSSDGKVLVKCHAGCRQADVIAELRRRGLWPEDGNNSPAISGGSNGRHTSGSPVLHAPRKPESSTMLAVDCRERMEADGWTVAAEYYPAGDVSRRGVEYRHRSKVQIDKPRPEKTHRWEHLAADQKWYLGKGDGGPMAPFVNDVFSERDTPSLAIGVEGGGKAVAAGELGLPAFSFRDADDFRVLEGWRVVLWPDKDAAGTKAVQAAIEKLRPHSREILLIQPPDELPSKGDIVDCIQILGWGREDIDALIAEAKPVASPPQPIRSIDELPPFWECGGASMVWAVEDMIGEATLVMFSGESGSGKTTLAWAIARDICRGVEFAGRKTTQRPVLILDRENPIGVTRDRGERLGITREDDIRVWGGWLREEAPAPNAEILLRWVMEQKRKPLILADSLIRFLSGSENDATESSASIGGFRRLVDAGATVVLLHHSGKAETAKDYRGSSDLKAAIDVGFNVKNLGGDRLGRMVLRTFKSRYIVPSEILLDYADGAFIGESRPTVTTVSDRLRDLLTEHAGVLTRDFETLAAANGIGRNQARRWRDENLTSGKVEIRTGDKRSQRLYWVDGPNRGQDDLF